MVVIMWLGNFIRLETLKDALNCAHAYNLTMDKKNREYWERTEIMLVMNSNRAL